MKKLISSFLIITLLVTCVVIAYADNYSNPNILAVGDICITQSEYDLAKKTVEFYENQGVNTSNNAIPSYKSTNNDPILETLMSRKMIERLFVEKQIDLTSEEKNYVNNYCTEINMILKDMVQNGDDSEKKNALEVLQLKENEREYCRLTQEEADARETAEVAYCIKFEKLIDSYFNGNSDELISYLKNRMAK